jgi:hypothetical protein
MSYKTHKRRQQRLRHSAKIKFWQEVRRRNSSQAFEEWRAIHAPVIRDSYIRGLET